jgi:hypothetical protein
VSATGRTSWWARDAAEHDRELIVELGEEYGPVGPYTLTVLKDLAQQQRHQGTVRTGFRVLRTKTFAESPELSRLVVERAATIGALDDLVIDEDGRRFSCRISGWDADQVRGKETLKKRAQRSGDEGDKTGQVGDESPKRREIPPTRPNQTIESPPIPPRGNRSRDIQQFDEDCRAFAETRGVDGEDGWINVRGALRDGASTKEEVLAYFERWRPDLLPREVAA